MHFSSANLSFILIFALTAPALSPGQILPEANKAAASQQTADSAAKMLATKSPVARTSKQATTAEGTPRATHERFAPFLADQGFKSELLLQNVRLDVPVTVTPALILAAEEIKLEP